MNSNALRIYSFTESSRMHMPPKVDRRGLDVGLRYSEASPPGAGPVRSSMQRVPGRGVGTAVVSPSPEAVKYPHRKAWFMPQTSSGACVATAGRPHPQQPGDPGPQTAQGAAVPAQHPRRIPRRDRPHSRQTERTLTSRFHEVSCPTGDHEGRKFL